MVVKCGGVDRNFASRALTRREDFENPIREIGLNRDPTGGEWASQQEVTWAHFQGHPRSPISQENTGQSWNDKENTEPNVPITSTFKTSLT